jgi:RNA polymerase sigma factor (sigma-70 family)
MQIQSAGKTKQGVQTLFQLGSLGSWTDGQLMTRFVADREGSEAAFRMLLARHGPMVLGVCRRILDDPHAAEDAFQATFLVLVRKARMLRDQDRLTSWLYGVALRTARKARATESRRRLVEGRAVQETPRSEGRDSRQAELRAVIDEEIHRLPEHYRLPLVLCHLEGLQHEEVAERLGCPVGTVESRLFRARQRLRAGLVRRGLAPAFIGVLGALRPPNASASLTPLIEATVRAALLPAGKASGGMGSSVLAAAGSLFLLKSAAGSSGGLALLALLVGSAIVFIGMDFYPANGTFTPPVPMPAEAQADVPVANPATSSPQESPARSPLLPTAHARAMSRIVIDGQLDDWPRDMKRYPIHNRLRTHPMYDPDSRTASRTESRDGRGEFMVGYNREDGQIYIAVAVHDGDLVVGNGDCLSTDAAEVYLEGLGSGLSLPGPDEVLWSQKLSADRMPVLEYVGLPGRGPVYGQAGSDGTALMYGRIEDSNTEMRFRRSAGVIVYEWAVQAFDRYPDKPTRLDAGKHLRFDVTIVDRDRDRTRPYFTSWTQEQTRFRGFDAGQLGELILDDSP